MNQIRMRRALLTHSAALIATILIVNLNATAQQAPAPPAASKITRDYQPGDLLLDQSRVYIHVDKTGLGHVHGVAGLIKEGRMAFDGVSAPGRLVFDMTSFVADVPYARRYLGLEGDKSESTQQEVTETMLGADVLDVQHYPTAEFEIASIQNSGKTTSQGIPLVRIDGKLTLHGTTRPVAFMAQADPQGAWIHVRGAFSMLQSEYGIKPLTKALGTIGVKDELKVWGDLWVAAKATRQ